jgi:hypothetical protein
VTALDTKLFNLAFIGIRMMRFFTSLEKTILFTAKDITRLSLHKHKFIYLLKQQQNNCVKILKYIIIQKYALYSYTSEDRETPFQALVPEQMQDRNAY